MDEKKKKLLFIKLQCKLRVSMAQSEHAQNHELCSTTHQTTKQKNSYIIKHCNEQNDYITEKKKEKTNICLT